MSPETIRDSLRRLAAVHRETIVPEVADAYIESLTDLSDADAYEDAIAALMRHSHWFPKPAEIRQAYTEAMDVRRSRNPALEQYVYAKPTPEEYAEGARIAREVAGRYGKDGVLKSF